MNDVVIRRRLRQQFAFIFIFSKTSGPILTKLHRDAPFVTLFTFDPFCLFLYVC